MYKEAINISPKDFVTILFLREALADILLLSERLCYDQLFLVIYNAV
jgi:hypothetical protein